jgi:hypothetical protein
MAIELDGILLPAGTEAALRVPVEEAEAVVERHNRLGTCPNCHAKVERFCAYQVEDEAVKRFGCEHCSPLVASVTRQAHAARLKERN